MSARELIADLGSAGILVWPEDGRLIVEPASRLTPTLRERIKAHRTELLAETLPRLDYTQGDLAELDRLIARWHELARVPGAAETLAIRRCMAPVDVRLNLESFRAMVQQLDAESG